MATPYEVMASVKPALVERLATNPDLCNFILALLGRSIILCAEKGTPLEGIEIADFTAEDLPEGDVLFKARIEFHMLPITAASLWPPQSDFAQYTRSKAHGLGMALEKNPRLNAFFQTMVEMIEKYADHKGIQFGRLKAQKALITTDNILMLQVGKNVLTN